MINRRRLPNEYNVNKQVVIIKPGLFLCVGGLNEKFHTRLKFSTLFQQPLKPSVGEQVNQSRPHLLDDKHKIGDKCFLSICFRKINFFCFDGSTQQIDES